MRTLRVVITGGVVPVLAATIIAPLDGCGGQQTCPTVDAAPGADTGRDTGGDGQDLIPADTGPDMGSNSDGGNQLTCSWKFATHIVQVPSPGIPADQGQLCAVSMPPALSNASAHVSFTSYSPQMETATGAISIPASIANLVVGLPTIKAFAGIAEVLALKVTNMQKTAGGFTFDASWPAPIPKSPYGTSLAVKVTMTIACGDGGTQTVESTDRLEMCVEDNSYTWVSSGGACTVCEVIAEMAPSPIVSDNRGDDLPLARHLRLRVVELARAGRDVLLLAENDGGDDAAYEWRVSGGTITEVAPDIVLWKLPEEDVAPFGQVAVWNDTGAAVENFLWGAA